MEFASTLQEITFPKYTTILDTYQIKNRKMQNHGTNRTNRLLSKRQPTY